MTAFWENGQHRWPRVRLRGRDRVVCEGLATLGRPESCVRNRQRVTGTLERGPRLQTPAKWEESIGQRWFRTGFGVPSQTRRHGERHGWRDTEKTLSIIIESSLMYVLLTLIAASNG
jgi:hypothetical protein